MAEENDGEDKEFEPSQRKLEKAREQGDAVRSEELQAAAAIWGLLLVLVGAGGWIVLQAGGAGMSFLDHPDLMKIEQGQLFPAALHMALPATLLLIGPAILVLIWLIVSRGIVFAPSRLVPKPSRLSLISNAKQKFGRSGLMDFFRRSLKLLAIGLALTLYLKGNLDDLIRSLQMDASVIAQMIANQVIGFLVVVAAVSTVFGGVDFIWQRFEFIRRNRMTRKEMMDETKDSEGDPHMKADRKRRAQAIASQQMMADVPKADVVIVNPTHYAVALRWDRTKGKAPVCVAKGVDEIAARIRELAQESAVPLHRDPPTARALFATVEIGQEISREHYPAVAAAIRFADAMRRKAKERRGR